MINSGPMLLRVVYSLLNETFHNFFACRRAYELTERALGEFEYL